MSSLVCSVEYLWLSVLQTSQWGSGLTKGSPYLKHHVSSVFLCVDQLEELVPVQDPCWHSRYLSKYDANPHNYTPCILWVFFKFDFLIHFTYICWRSLWVIRELFFFYFIKRNNLRWKDTFFFVKWLQLWVFYLTVHKHSFKIWFLTSSFFFFFFKFSSSFAPPREK